MVIDTIVYSISPTAHNFVHGGVLGMTGNQLTNPGYAERQYGVVLITVLLMLVFISILAVYRADHQNIAIKRAANIKQAELSFQIAAGGEQWAVKLLENDLEGDRRSGNDDIDHLNEVWANLGPPVKVEGTESFMQVIIHDEQGKFNLNNLIQGRPPRRSHNDKAEKIGEESTESETGAGNNAADGKVYWYQLFQNLLAGIALDPQLADVLVDWVDKDSDVTGLLGAEDNFYQSLRPSYRAANQPLSSLAELSKLRYFTPEIIETLRPFVTVIPLASNTEYTPINVNTAAPQLFRAMAAQSELTPDNFISLIEIRLHSPFKNVEEFIDNYQNNTAGSLMAGIDSLLDVRSAYFSSHSCARTGPVELKQSSLLRKKRSEQNVKAVSRRISYGCAERAEADTDG